MLFGPLVAPAALACPPLPPAVPIGVGGYALSIADDGVAHLLLRDAAMVCWWTVGEDGDAAIRAAWPLPGPHPVGVAALGGGAVVLLGETAEGWALSVLTPGVRARDILVGGRSAPVSDDALVGGASSLGQVLRFSVDDGGRIARLGWRTPVGLEVYCRVDLVTGRVEELARGVRVNAGEVTRAAR